MLFILAFFLLVPTLSHLFGKVNRLLEEKGLLVSKLKAMNDEAETSRAAAAVRGGGSATGEEVSLDPGGEGAAAAAANGGGQPGQQTEQFQTHYSQVVLQLKDINSQLDALMARLSGRSAQVRNMCVVDPPR